MKIPPEWDDAMTEDREARRMKALVEEHAEMRDALRGILPLLDYPRSAMECEFQRNSTGIREILARIRAREEGEER